MKSSHKILYKYTFICVNTKTTINNNIINKIINLLIKLKYFLYIIYIYIIILLKKKKKNYFMNVTKFW